MPFLDHRAFYDLLFAPAARVFGSIDDNTIVPIIGFDGGGPLNLSTIGMHQKTNFVTYISCELAVRDDQVPSSKGNFELMCHCNDQDWVSLALTQIGRISLEAKLDHLHTIDLSQVTKSASLLQGAVLERFCTVQVQGLEYSIFRVHGVTSEELEFAMKSGSNLLLKRLNETGIYPNTNARRKSCISPTESR